MYEHMHGVEHLFSWSDKKMAGGNRWSATDRMCVSPTNIGPALFIHAQRRSGQNMYFLVGINED